MRTLNDPHVRPARADQATWRTTMTSTLEYRPKRPASAVPWPLTTLDAKTAVDQHRVDLYEQGRAMLLEAGYQQVSPHVPPRRGATGPVLPPGRRYDGLGCARGRTRVALLDEWRLG
jgi:hypothetical protein